MQCNLKKHTQIGDKSIKKSIQNFKQNNHQRNNRINEYNNQTIHIQAEQRKLLRFT